MGAHRSAGGAGRSAHPVHDVSRTRQVVDEFVDLKPLRVPHVGRTLSLIGLGLLVVVHDA